jgi:hypothetical protein
VRCGSKAVRVLKEGRDTLVKVSLVFLNQLPQAWKPHEEPSYLSLSLFQLWGGGRLSPLGTPTANWSIVPAPDDG